MITLYDSKFELYLFVAGLRKRKTMEKSLEEIQWQIGLKGDQLMLCMLQNGPGAMVVLRSCLGRVKGIVKTGQKLYSNWKLLS
jgi:hypothetical protein